MVQNDMLLNKICEKKNIKVVAFDFFDTLVHRKCHHESVLFLWAKKISQLYKYKFSAEFVYQLRKMCEVRGKELLGKEEISYKELIRLVFSNLLDEFDLSDDFEKFYYFSYSTEIEIEKNEIEIDDNLLNQVRILSEFYKVIIISDFYLDKNFFIEILKKHGYENLFYDIFVSSDVSCRKSTGKLYEYVALKLGVNYECMAMIGDNKKSDYYIPNHLGIYAIHKSFSNRYKIFINERTLNNECGKIINKSCRNNIYIGYLPELCYFISKLYRVLSSKKIKKVYFLSREGQLLKRMFDIYQDKFYTTKEITTNYLYVSRKSTLIPSLKEIDQEEFDIIFRQYKNLTICQFLKNIGFIDDVIIKIISECGLSNDEIVTSNDDQVLEIVKKNKLFRKEYDLLVKEQKKLFLKYLSQQGIKDEEDVVVVDVGWKGTIQDNLTRILNKCSIKGLYLGITSGNICSSDKKEGILFDIRKDEKLLYDIYSRGYYFYEYLLLADHSSVDGYECNENGKIIPKLKEDSIDVEGYKYSKVLIDEFIKVYEKYLDVYVNSLFQPCDNTRLYKNTLKRQCIYMPFLWKQKKEISKKIFDNFGVVSIVKEHKSTKKIKNDYMYVEYVYRGLDMLHLSKLNFLANMYCKIVYWIKLHKLERDM